MSHSKARTLRETLREASMRIPETEARHLLRWALDVSDTWMFLHADASMPDAGAQKFASAIERRERGEPVAYIEGRRGFWTLDLEVSPATLIPRVETERLVEAALAVLPENSALEVLDLGTGSGAIALALATERPMAHVIGVDQSEAALAVAERNRLRYAADNAEFIQSAWYAQLGARKFHCIVSNPPYIPEGDAHLAQGDLRFEPRSALSSGDDGLDDIRLIVMGATSRLHPGGALLIEHGFDQATSVRTLLETAGFERVETLQDLESRDRVSLGFQRGA